MISTEAQKAFAECSAFYRDTMLPSEVLSMYRVGLLFREPTFCDATYKFGGFAAPHRYLIISAHARNINALSQHPEWGLCIWQIGRIFKVIGVHQNGPNSQVTLLDVPEKYRAEFAGPNLHAMEIAFANQAAQQFEAALQLPVRPEHQTRLWLDRLKYPVGVDEEGRFYESWLYSS